ncbi:hypothetical protein [uncultured Dokdonia sp.]|uniref:hypothetical protein n=1 Tax=uncultured Dokdonia sp. TaxID=575653 RepID=UPI0026181324|nr:hypothetical protein [uncultured Dokdonia sp.]
MAPIKLEDNMKERLEERTIEPTMAAWDKISSQLDIEQGAKKNRRVLWMSIAASFVGGALIALFVFQNMDTMDTSPELVNTDNESLFLDPTKETVKDQGIKNQKTQQIEEAVVQETTTSTQELEAEKQKDKTKSVTKKNIKTASLGINKDTVIAQNTKEATSVKQETVVVSVQKQEIQNTTTIEDPKDIEKIITQNTGEAVAQVGNKESVTDVEIEALLKDAQREIVSKQIFNQNTNTVDANALLLDVEAEVAPTSFRNKIFEVIAEGYEKAKDAVVNRNN